LENNGVLVCIKPDAHIADQTEMKFDFCILYCTHQNEEAIKKSLSLDGLYVQSIEHYQADHFKQGLTRGNLPAVESVLTGSAASPDSPAKGSVGYTIRVDSQKLDRLMTLSGDLVIAKAKFARIAQLLSQNISHIKADETISETMVSDIEYLKNEMSLLQELSEEQAPRKDKILSKLDNVLLNVTPTNVDQNIAEISNLFSEETNALEKISSNIQDSVMQTRLIPVDSIFSQFKRVVRDISKDNNKDVRLMIIGGETELDKKLVDSLKDPLTHLVRNAIGHGIEAIDMRNSLGKPGTGTLILKASNKGNFIWIEISDDGKGINPDKIVVSAVEKGLITQKQADQMTLNDKFNLIFMPGFSTAGEITNLSGRGVGMDVVKDMISSLHGTVEIKSEVGRGTTFILKIPLTLAIVNVLLIELDAILYAFPLDSVNEIISLNEDEFYKIDGTDAVKLRGHALPIIDLKKIIGIKMSKTEENEECQSKKIVIISDQETQLGVEVDHILSKEEIVIKPFSSHFSHLKGLTGVSVLADGNVALILDIATIINDSK